jgi:uncharacterized repeat protein (TIGR03803 family)
MQLRTIRAGVRSLLVGSLLFFAASASVDAQTESVIYTFQSESDGYNIGGAPLVLDRAGNLYGSTTNGGSNACAGFYPGCGTIYQLLRPVAPGAAWVKNSIWQFQGGVDGGFPGGLIIHGGKLIGQAGTGGNGACSGGCGYIFELTPPAAQGKSWTKTMLYDFPDAAAECSISTSDRSGNFFGVGPSAKGNGSVCQVTPSVTGGSWTTTTLYTFRGIGRGQVIGDGSGPIGVTFDAQGNLWGATVFGGYCQPFEGGSCFGTVFRISPPAEQGGSWTESLLYRLRPTDQNPTSGVTIDRAGAVYGVTYTEVYRVGSAGFTVIDSFPDVNGNARAPTGGVVFDAEGNLYGTTGAGGAFSNGAVYKLTRPVNGIGPWTQTILHSFAGNADGFNPEVRLTVQSGTLYGFTQNGGGQGCNMGGDNVGCGVIFQVTP